MKHVIPLALLSATVCSAAWAQVSPSTPSGTPTTPGSDSSYPAGGSGATPAPTTFSTLDKNKDGVIKKDEAKSSVRLTAAFDTADKNGDSALSKTEFDAYFGAP